MRRPASDVPVRRPRPGAPMLPLLLELATAPDDAPRPRRPSPAPDADDVWRVLLGALADVIGASRGAGPGG